MGFTYTLTGTASTLVVEEDPQEQEEVDEKRRGPLEDQELRKKAVVVETCLGEEVEGFQEREEEGHRPEAVAVCLGGAVALQVGEALQQAEVVGHRPWASLLSSFSQISWGAVWHCRWEETGDRTL